MSDVFDVIMPDYTNSTVNLTASIVKHFGGIPLHPTLSALDKALEDAENVVLILIDGMGSFNIKAHLQEDDFLRKHTVLDYSAVFPPTTVAALTSLESGLYQSEHCRLGWDMYYENRQEVITTFRSDIPDKELPYKRFWDTLPVKTERVSPSSFGKNKKVSIGQQVRRIRKYYPTAKNVSFTPTIR